MPLNAWWTGAELEYGIDDSGAKVLIVDAERYERIAEHLPALPDVERMSSSRGRRARWRARRRWRTSSARPATWADLPDIDLPARRDRQPDDDATIFYTSGTTGNPKGALGTHRNFMTNIMSGGYVAARTLLLRRGEAIPDPTPAASG